MRSAAPVRIARYLATMFPPFTMVPVGTAKFLSIYLALQALSGMAPLHLGPAAIVGSLTTVLWLMLVRVQDDIADASHDRRLALAGDPRYRDRPTVTGLVTVSELRWLLVVTVVVLFAMHAILGRPLITSALGIGLLVTWLAFHWFFIPALTRDPQPLAYLARKSLILLLSAYATVVFLDTCRPGILTLWTIPLLLAPGAEVAAWETSRKIRIPEDETEYGTYSKVLGWRTASVLPAAFVSFALICLVPVSRAAGLGWTFTGVLLASGAVSIAACFRFRVAPTRQRANLRPYMELFGAVAHGGLSVALGLALGVVIA